MEYVLLVTWLFGGSGISSYSTEFASDRQCEMAKVQLQNEAARHAEEQMKRVGTKLPSGATIVGPGPSPVLLATCAKKK